MPPASTTTNLKRKEESPTASQTGQATLGQISFINTLPVVHPITSGAVDIGCKMEFGNPAQLNARLRKGELELGAMSSFYFLEDGGFELFPDISISGTGRVGSVLLFSKVQLANLHGQTIDVPDSSATSIKLMQLLLKEEFGADVQLRQRDYQPGTSQPNAEAILLIGDKALKFDQELSRDHLRIDLAQWWFNRFNLPFVFGVWGARQNWAQNNQSRFHEIAASLVQSCALGLTDLLPAVINEASRRTQLSHDRLHCYYTHELDYQLTDHHRQALQLFGQLCRKNGLL